LELLFWGTIILAVLMQSWLVLLAFPAGLVVWSIVVGLLFPLKPIDRVEVARVRRKAAIHVGLLLILIVAVGILFGGN